MKILNKIRKLKNKKVYIIDHDLTQCKNSIIKNGNNNDSNLLVKINRDGFIIWKNNKIKIEIKSSNIFKDFKKYIVNEFLDVDKIFIIINVNSTNNHYVNIIDYIINKSKFYRIYLRSDKKFIVNIVNKLNYYHTIKLLKEEEAYISGIRYIDDSRNIIDTIRLLKIYF